MVILQLYFNTLCHDVSQGFCLSCHVEFPGGHDVCSVCLVVIHCGNECDVI